MATDSYRLAVRDLPGTAVLGEGQKVLVPSRALAELQRLVGAGGEVTLRLGERDATFEVGGARLTTRLIEGEFPNYRQLIPPQLPEPPHRRPRGAARRRPPGEAPGPGRHAGAPAPCAATASS